MEDEEWCEYIRLMRLLSRLRQSQSYCTDNECMDPNDILGRPCSAGERSTADENRTFETMCFFFMLAGVLFFYVRPALIRLRHTSPNVNRFWKRIRSDDSSPPPPLS